MSAGVKVGPQATPNMAAIRGRRFFNVYNWGGVRTFTSVGKMAGVDAKFFGRMILTNYVIKDVFIVRRGVR